MKTIDPHISEPSTLQQLNRAIKTISLQQRRIIKSSHIQKTKAQYQKTMKSQKIFTNIHISDKRQPELAIKDLQQ